MSIDQDQKPQVDFYLNFFPNNLSNFDDSHKNEFSQLFDGLIENELSNQELHILILGVGAGYFEIPLLYYLYNKYTNIKLNITAIDKSNRYLSIFYNAVNEIVKDINVPFTRDRFKTINLNSKLDVPYSVKTDRLEIQTEVKNIEQDYEENPEYDGCLSFKSEQYDIVLCSFILNHINFWRSLLVEIRTCLKPQGRLLISEISGDSLLLNGNLSKWKVDKTKDDLSGELFNFFKKFYSTDFSILSDNSEVSAINIDLADKFLHEIELKSTQSVEFQLDAFSTNKKELFSAIENKVYSCFTENVNFHSVYFGKDITKDLESDKSDTNSITFTSKVKWNIYKKISGQPSKILSDGKYGVTTNNLNDYTISMINQFQWLLYQKNPLSQILPDAPNNLRDFLSFKIYKAYKILRSHEILLNNIRVANISFNNPYFKFDEEKFFKGMFLFFTNSTLKKDNRVSNILKAKKYFEKLQNNLDKNFTNLSFFYNNLSHYIPSRFVIKFIINNHTNPSVNFLYSLYISEVQICFNPSMALILENFDPYLKEAIGENKIKSNLKSIKQSLHIAFDLYNECFIYFFPVIIHIPDEKEKQFLNLLLVSDSELSEEEVGYYSELIYKFEYVIDYNGAINNFHFKNKILNQQLKTAIISILVDSYAHNISAHSLAALKWWMDLRNKMLDKRFKVPPTGLTLSCIQPCLYDVDNTTLSETTERYYEALGKTDSIYNKNFYSLYDLINFVKPEYFKTLLQIQTEVKDKDDITFHPRFPVPIDYALAPFFRFLRDKGAFWSGVTRDTTFGGETKTWFKILWEDFANNPLYLGTIAKTEGVTKLNIYLKVKIGESHIEGKFVTIDLSLIDYESAIAESNDLEINKDNIYQFDLANSQIATDQEYIKKLKNKIKTYNDPVQHNNDRAQSEPKKLKILPFVDTDKYSKYSFIKLGAKFAEFREVLDNENKAKVFLPAGIVGEHALFTIFENTIRNIKHFNDPDEIKEIKTHGINLWISIEEKKINDNQKPELFCVGTWLQHKTPLIRIVENKEKKIEPQILIFDITEQTIKPILDDNSGSPRMGGNSQDKVCASMLFNNHFSSVEKKQSTRDREYFPWITFATVTFSNNDNNENPNNNEFIPKTNYDDEKEVLISKIVYLLKQLYYSIQKDSNYENRLEGIDKEIINIIKSSHLSNNINEKLKNYFNNFNTGELLTYIKKIAELYKYQRIESKGYLKKYIYLWQGTSYLSISSDTDFKSENISRFKFIAIPSEDPDNKDKLMNYARQEGVIRIIENKDKELDDKNLYYLWLKNWLNFEDNQEYCIRFKQGDSTLGLLKIINESITYRGVLPNETTDTINEKGIIFLVHSGSNQEKYECNVRSHGKFWQKFFCDISNKEILNLRYAENQNGIMQRENYEYPQTKSDLLWEFVECLQTRITIFDKRVYERIPNEKKDLFHAYLKLFVYEEDINEWNKFKDISIEDAHVLIMHLSFIEKIEKSGVRYSEETINEFIDNELNSFSFKKNFIFIITTGRGRDLWRVVLNDQQKKFTTFKPIESILSAVEEGVSNNDHFDIKYNLVKLIFGS